jgi:hypothetical protein
VSAIVPAEQPDVLPEALVGVSAEVAELIAHARSIEVTTDAQAQEATGLLAEFKSRKDRIERARKFLIADPTNQIKKFNAICKGTAAPLAEADQIVRAKVLAFRQEQERSRAEEQARLDAERKREEAAAAAERQRAEEAARAAEREAAEAAARAREVASAEEAKLEAEMADLDDDDLLQLDVGGDGTERVVAHRLREQRLAERAAAKKRQVAEEATQASIAAQSAPALQVAAAAPLATAGGKAAVSYRWKATVIDEAAVPRQYLKVDMGAINAAVRAGVREIDGCEIKREAGLAVSANG